MVHGGGCGSHLPVHRSDAVETVRAEWNCIPIIEDKNVGEILLNFSSYPIYDRIMIKLRHNINCGGESV